MTGRAMTPEQKRAAVERVLAAWLLVPEQHLGQLIDNAVSYRQHVERVDVFGIEDEALALACERFADDADPRSR